MTRKAIRSRLAKLEGARRLLPMAGPLAEGLRAQRTCATFCLDDASRGVFLALADDPAFLAFGGWPTVAARLDALVRDALAGHFPDTAPPTAADELLLWAHRWTHRVATWPGPAPCYRVARDSAWWRAIPTPETTTP